ncbi:MAG: ATP-binding protein [Chitinispirillales bacterium]|jgi:AAA15 family ATPase/GTPase|nr:ATP-binding protein [Chitinispirillales bacterium]
MLLKFKVKNYKSFVEDTIFSMEAAPKQSGLDYSLFSEKVRERVDGKVNQRTIKGLCSSVIYGPNAAGKTNIIGAMEVLRSIVLRGDISNPKEGQPLHHINTAAFLLETIPNNQLSEPRPVEFVIEFFEKDLLNKKDLLINYELTVDFGSFLDSGYKRKIISEVLKVNGEIVFDRGEELILSDLKVIEEYITNSAKQKLETANEIVKDSLRPEELFLTNGFKFVFSVQFVEIMQDWFKNKLNVIYRADTIKVRPKIDKDKRLYRDKNISEAARVFGVSANDVAYITKNNDSKPELYSFFNRGAIPADMIESYGTIRFANIFPSIVSAIHIGGTLVVDEFDASIHPMALMSIINIFHNDEINVNRAQLIFNTHNPIFLNSSLFRRDEIKFVERNDETHISTLYSLADFKTSGEKGVRKHEDYLKNYFVNQYGAIKDVDFTPIFEDIINAAKNSGV